VDAEVTNNNKVVERMQHNPRNLKLLVYASRKTAMQDPA
jgi:hypothetical protein